MNNSGLENFLIIALKPDNMPIGAMLGIVAFLYWVAVIQMVKHDRLIKDKKKDKVYDEMIK